MKNIYSLILLFAIMVSGCSQDEVVKEQPSPSEPLIFTASFEDKNSRTYLNEDEHLCWTANDLISIFAANTYNQKYEFQGKTGANSGDFEAVTSNSYQTGNDLNRHYAIYPYNSSSTITENGVITATLPAEQSYAVKSFGLGANTMVAATADKNDKFLKFKNVGGYLELNLYGNDVTIKSITLQGNSNEKIAGSATITPVYNGNPTVEMANNATNTITLDCGEGVKIGSTAETATAFWIVIPPTTFEEGFTITITDINGGEFTKSTSKNIEIERNYIQPMADFEVETEKKPLVRSVHVSTAGELYKQISDSEKYNITSIKISGELNGTDVKFIREMTGRDVNNNKTSGTLVNLDLSEASIIEGGDVYYEDSSIQCKTSRNEVGEYMFYYCDKLQNIVLPNNTVSIGWRAFSGCGSLVSINMPNSIVSIGQSAFGNCTSLASIDLSNALVSIEYGAFIGCTSLLSLDIPDSVTSIGQDAISHCSSLTSLTIGDGMTSIRYGIINYCSNLTTLVIGNGVTYIDYSAFNYLYSLTSVTIGSGIISIYKNAFENCDKLTEFYCYATTPPRIDSSFESSIKGKATLYVPAGCESKYNSSNWGYLFYVKGMY